jgi:hypothetical protein
MNAHRLFSTAILVLGMTLVSILLISPELVCADGIVIYVDAEADPGGNGSSWGSAYKYLQDALSEANANGATNYEIWVAEGVYYPDEGAGTIADSRTMSFTLRYNNVQLYGGFTGTETAREQRDWEANVTVLSGDIDNNDITDDYGVTKTPTFNSYGECGDTILAPSNLNYSNAHLHSGFGDEKIANSQQDWVINITDLGDDVGMVQK